MDVVEIVKKLVEIENVLTVNYLENRIFQVE